MKMNKAIITVLILVLIVGFVSGIKVIADNSSTPSDIPVMPSTYYGKITVGNKEVRDNLELKAIVSGKECGQLASTKDSNYLLVIRGDDGFTPGCAVEGQEVSLMINNIEISKVNWNSGSFEKQDIKIEPSVLKDLVDDFVAKGKEKKQ